MTGNKKGFLIAGILLLALSLSMALLPGAFTSYGQKEMFDAWLSPSGDHILGTNSLGYDIFTELVYGAKDTLLVGLFSSVFTMIIGIAVGVLAAQRGAIGAFFSGLINIFMLLPRLIALIVVAAFVGQSRASLVFMIALFG